MRETLCPSEAAAICHVKRVAIHAAIKKGRLKASKISNRWQIAISALDEYRRNKYSRFNRKDRDTGSTIYDVAAGRWPVQYTAKWLGDKFGKPISDNRVYYLMKIGLLPAYRHGKGWVIKQEDAEALYKLLTSRQDEESLRMRLA